MRKKRFFQKCIKETKAVSYNPFFPSFINICLFSVIRNILCACLHSFLHNTKLYYIRWEFVPTAKSGNAVHCLTIACISVFSYFIAIGTRASERTSIVDAFLVTIMNTLSTLIHIYEDQFNLHTMSMNVYLCNWLH